MFEQFGYDNYLKEPEYTISVEAGKYQITISSKNNDTKYSLAIGEIEKFDFAETRNALKLIPLIKRDFFGESPISFIFSPFGWGMILVLFVLSFIFGWLSRVVLRWFAKTGARSSYNNIGIWDPIIRASIGVALLLLAIMTTWNPLLIFFSGFAFFEAIWSWCGMYAIMGRNSCKRG